MRYARSLLYLLLTIGVACSAPIRGAESSSSSQTNPISYASVDEALKELRAKPGITFRNQSGWIVAEDKAAFTVWLITPPGHPAYPTTVRRVLVNRSDGAYMDTAVRCFASQEICDKFFGGK